MNTTFKARKTVKAGIHEVAEFFTQEDMTKNYFPEIHKDTKGMSHYVRGSHKHVTEVFPDYQVPNQGFAWTAGHNTCIKVPRKDINANIQGVEVEYKAMGENTEIAIRVEFNPSHNVAGITAAYHVHMMIANKLDAFVRDIQAHQYDGFELSFA